MYRRLDLLLLQSECYLYFDTIDVLYLNNEQCNKCNRDEYLIR